MSKIIIGALDRKYAELLGELRTAEREIETVTGVKNIAEATTRIDRRKAELRADMDHLCHVARMFEPAWDRTKIRAKLPREAHLAPRGQTVRMAIQVLREADEPLTAREISKRIFAGGVRPPETTMKKVDGSVLAAMKRGVAEGNVVLVPGRSMRWSQAPYEPALLAD